jgi:hypothetical protein
MPSNILYFPAISTLGYTSAQNGQQLWRIGTKTSNTYNNTLTMELVFKYTDNASTFNLSGAYMTLFHMGTDSGTPGFSVVLFKNVSTGKISLGVRYRTSGNWTDLVGSFEDLSLAKYTSVQGFYVMFQYDKNTNVTNFYIKGFGKDTNPASASTPDFSFTTAYPGVNVGTQWGFGSLPQAIIYNNSTNPNGYDNVNSYNGYVAQNLSTFFLRTWSKLIPLNSTTNGVYAMFNTGFSAYSLYYLNQTFTYVPSITSNGSYANFDFQLYVPPPPSISLSSLANSAFSPNILVTLATSTTNFGTLNPTGSWNFSVNEATGYNVMTVSTINCILKGTKILTPDGYRRIEEIKEGDYITTHDGRKKEVIQTYSINAIHNKDTQCIIIKKGTFGAIEDLYISKNHAILIDDEFIIPDRKMPDKIEYVKDMPYYTYCNIMTDDYLRDSLVANGVAVETWGGYLPWLKDFKYKEPVIRNSQRNRLLLKI